MSRSLMRTCFFVCSVSCPSIWFALWVPHTSVPHPSVPSYGYNTEIFGIGDMCSDKETRIEHICTVFDQNGAEVEEIKNLIAFGLKMVIAAEMAGMLMMLFSSITLASALCLDKIDPVFPRIASCLMVCGGFAVYTGCVTLVMLIPNGLLPDLEANYRGYYGNIIVLVIAGTSNLIMGFFLGTSSWNFGRRSQDVGETVATNRQYIRCRYSLPARPGDDFVINDDDSDIRDFEDDVISASTLITTLDVSEDNDSMKNVVQDPENVVQDPENVVQDPENDEKISAAVD